MAGSPVTTAARYLASSFQAEKFAEIDPEEFYHFGLQRPLVRLLPGTLEREIVWPETEFTLCTQASRDVVAKIAKVKTGRMDLPADPVVIEAVEISDEA